MCKSKLICLLISPSYRIQVNGRIYRFEMHSYCGPSVLLKNDDIANRQPGEHHPFWEAVTCWHAQGERTGRKFPNGDRFAVWKKMPKKKGGLRLEPLPPRKT